MPTITVDGQDYLVDNGVTEAMIRAKTGSGVAVNPSTQPPSNALMNPNQPGWGQTVQDMASGVASGVPKALGNLINSGFKLAALPKVAYDKLTLGHPSPGLRKYDQALQGATSDFQKTVGGDYQPTTTPGSVAQSVGEGVGGVAFTGGRSLPELAAGAASGGLSNAGERLLSDQNGEGGWAGGYAGAAAPMLALAMKKYFRGGAPVYSNARENLENLHPGEMADAQAAQAAAKAGGVFPMAWQLFPPRSTMRNTGAGAATLPEATNIQSNLRNQWGGVQGENQAANQLTQSAQQAPTVAGQTTAENLAEALRRDESLRGANAGLPSSGHASTEQAGNVALGMEAFSPMIPHGARAMMSGMELMRGGAIKRILAGPSIGQAADKLYSIPSIEEFQQAAAYNPRVDAFRHLLQGAYGLPGALNLAPTQAPYKPDNQ